MNPYVNYIVKAGLSLGVFTMVYWFFLRKENRFNASRFYLLGALVLYGRRGGSSHVGGQAMSYAIFLFIFGFVMPNIDNYAHLGGFLGGYAAARWLDPMRPERVDHLIAAIVCIVLTALSVIASVYTFRIA